MKISELIDAIRAKRVLITDHADEEASEDDLKFEDIWTSVFEGEIIEEYPTDKPYPSCLVFGMTPDGEPVHSVWGYDRGRQIAILIAVYCPEPARWINWRTRRKSSGTS